MAPITSHPHFKPVAYGLLNIVTASSIVFANKAVFQVYGFKFTACLTWIHTVFTLVGMYAFAAMGLFQVKVLPQVKLLPLAGAYVAYIVLCNLSLAVNTVSFYQIMKIAVAPTVLVVEACFFHKIPTPKVLASVCLVCTGIAVATITDTQMIKNVYGLLVGLAATVMTALYQIWAGTKQKELKAGSMQLLHQYTPQATVLLGLLVLVMEPVRPSKEHPAAILNYSYTGMAVAAILVSSALGLLVSLSTFLVIGATSSLTYNVVGHLKTVIILTGGCLFFGDEISFKKLLGICIAMGGIVWYTAIKMQAAPAATPPVYIKATAGTAGQPEASNGLPVVVVDKTRDVDA